MMTPKCHARPAEAIVNKVQVTPSTGAVHDPDRRLLALLADGRLHSGEELAQALGVTRAAVWKRLAALVARGVILDRIRGRGYRLAQPLDLLDAERIQARLRSDIRTALHSIRVDFSTDSTSRQLLQAADCHGRLALAEFQTHGRGRRGNVWLSPLASGICMSLGWRLDPIPHGVGALSILAGAALIRALQRAGADAVGVKWPNDLVFQGRKLGGMLIESRAQLAGPMEVVIGIGLNVRLPGELEVAGDNRVADLSQCCTQLLTRNEIAALMVEELIDMLTSLAAGRTSAYFEQWRRHDVGIGRDGELRMAAETLRGRVLGISDAGMLRMSVRGVEREFTSGDLSLRIF